MAPLSDSDSGAEVLDGRAQSLLEIRPRLPAEQLARKPDVGLTDLWVVNRERTVHDAAVPTHEPQDRLRELEDRHLARVAEVHGTVVAGFEKSDDALDEIRDVAEAARLLAVAIHRDVLAAQCLHDEVRHDAAV